MLRPNGPTDPQGMGTRTEGFGLLQSVLDPEGVNDAAITFVDQLDDRVVPIASEAGQPADRLPSVIVVLVDELGPAGVLGGPRAGHIDGCTANIASARNIAG